MIHRFADFEIDESRRELRLHGRELSVQPRVFALLVYFARNPDRVIAKDELLETLWPGTVVVDGALQRVVSLARSALRQGEMHDAIRTYSRHGYRFCPAPQAVAAAATNAVPGEPLERAALLLDRGEWLEAAAAFATADAASALPGAELERWALALQWSGNGDAAIEPLERAVAAYLSQTNRRAAARAAAQLAQIALERLQLAVAKGWQKRAETYLRGDDRSRELGLVLYMAVRLALVEGSAERAYEDAQRIHELGRELGDADLEGLGLAYSGHALLTLGDVDGGLDRQSEAAAAVLSGQITPWVGSVIYCSVIWTCRNRADWQRAAQWTEQFKRWCDRHKLAAFPGTCRLHRAEVLSISGHLAEAEVELGLSQESLATWAPWALGDMHRIRGDLQLARGELDAADESYKRSRAHGWDPQPGHAMLQVALGQADAGVRALELTLEERSWIPRESRGSLLAHLAIAAAAAGRLETAAAALAELDAHPEHRSTPALTAYYHAARAALLAAQARHGESVSAWRAAAQQWREVGSPLYAARARLELGKALLATGAREHAAMELAAAETAFAENRAERLAGLCAELASSI